MGIYQRIKVVVIDVDGVLTDGIYQISSIGNVIKSFYTRDFYGIERLMIKGIKVVILSQSHDRVISEQIDRICDHSHFWRCCYELVSTLLVYTEVEDKKGKVEEILNKYNWTWENVAYIGDAENDIESMKEAGFTACPVDAIPEVRELSLYPSSFSGGKGAVYDFCNYILKKISEEDNENF